MSGSINNVKLDPDKCKCGSPFTSVVLKVITIGDLAAPDDDGLQDVEFTSLGYDDEVFLHSSSEGDIEWVGAYCHSCRESTNVKVIEAW